MSNAHHDRYRNAEGLVRTSFLSNSPEELENVANERRLSKYEEDTNTKGLTLSVKPDRFRLPFSSKSAVSVKLENKNTCYISFTVDSNSPLTLTIDPQAGCIAPGDVAHIIVGRPMVIPTTRRSEHLIFKIKYCNRCNSEQEGAHASHHQKTDESNGHSHFHKISSEESQNIKHKHNHTDSATDERCPSLRTPENFLTGEDSSDRIYVIKNGLRASQDFEPQQDTEGKDLGIIRRRHTVNNLSDAAILGEEISDSELPNIKMKFEGHRDTYHILKKARQSSPAALQQHHQERRTSKKEDDFDRRTSKREDDFDGSHDKEYIEKHGEELTEETSDPSEHYKPSSKKHGKRKHGHKGTFNNRDGNESRWPRKFHLSPIREQNEEGEGEEGILQGFTRRLSWPINSLINLFKSTAGTDVQAERDSTSDEDVCSDPYCSKCSHTRKYQIQNKRRLKNKYKRVLEAKQKVLEHPMWQKNCLIPYMIIVLLSIIILVLLSVCDKKSNISIPFLKKQASFWEKYNPMSIPFNDLLP